MGIFDSNSKKTNITTTTTKNVTQAAHGNSIVAGEGASISLVDPGARSIVNETQAFLGETFASALGMTERTNQRFIEGVASGEIETHSDSSIKRSIPILVGVAIVVGGFVWWSKS